MDIHEDNEELFSPEPFSVDLFSERHRFSLPNLVQFRQHMWRWSIYGFIPFFVCIAVVALFFMVVIHPQMENIDRAQGDGELYTLICFGAVGTFVPVAFLFVWYRRLPWWFLNGTEKEWRVIRLIAEENRHRFPDDFWHPFMYNEFGLQEGTLSGEEQSLDFEMDITGFIGVNINIQYRIPKRMAGTPFDKIDFYLDTAYGEPEEDGLRIYGERMNVFVPYWAIKKFEKRGACEIVLQLEADVTGIWKEICVVMANFPTLQGDRKLRDKLYQQIAAAKDPLRV